MPVNKKAVLFIVGPTAIGKTELAIIFARRINGEIISSDSMQVYKGMDILSQSPDPAKIKKIRYHLVKFLAPQKEFNVAYFINKASILIDDIIRRGHVPIIAGGSGLYIKGLIDGLFPSPEADMRFRKKMFDSVALYGPRRLHKRLEKIDPEAAKLIHPNDSRRVIRALEIWHSTGKTMTELKSQTRGISGKYNIKIFGLTAPREDIYSNIDSRVDRMFKAGLVNEVQRLSKKNLSQTAKAILGFKEITGYLNKEYDLKNARDLLKRNTRHFAKRQLTWFKGDKRIKWFDVDRISEKEILRRMARWNA
ncbi:MAG: tRNA (adenosine(37)-N6)-dimethylallyltransferase MiaA [Candidatus Omnitrophica bacterium]|nr:tRNA (adenosine(37)-N6)-dimethylallyltransferase MiaA [Candidatus Omnitrophota bacterium]